MSNTTHSPLPVPDLESGTHLSEISFDEAKSSICNLLMITHKGELDTLYTANGRRITLWTFRLTGLPPASVSFQQDISPEGVRYNHAKNCRFFEIPDDLIDQIILAWAKDESFEFLLRLIPERKEATS